MEQEYLKLYSDVTASQVDWLWYPYIPYGKITLLEGDPGEGKSTLMMNLIAPLSTAGFMPDGSKVPSSCRIIYQCSEDDASDTIKPRLEACGADCSRVAFIDESLIALTLDDEKLRMAIESFRAELLVIDPVQAYLNEGTSLMNAGQIRKMMQKLGFWASAYHCAIVLIGHLNKKEKSRELYRSFGSIDIVAYARSVLQVNRVEDSQTMRYIRQVKNSLAAAGADFGFEIDPVTGFRWLGPLNRDHNYEWQNRMPPSAQDRISDLLGKLLAHGPVPATEVDSYFIDLGISLKSVRREKAKLGVRSFRQGRQWFWCIDTPKD